MAMSVTYTNFGGEIIHENRGGTETFYTSDPLGSMIEGRNSSGTQTFSATYWPYGEVRTSTGTNPGNLGYVGALGYYNETSARTYVRARFLRKELARWLNVDPLWPDESGFGYAMCSPVDTVDPFGMKPCSKAEIEFCKCECAGRNLDYATCEVIILPGPIKARVLDCGCKPKKCREPLTSELQALGRGENRMRREYGKCSLIKKGVKTTADICENGTHQTWTFQCGKNKISVSVICCPCLNSAGIEVLDCRDSVHLARF